MPNKFAKLPLENAKELYNTSGEKLISSGFLKIFTKDNLYLFPKSSYDLLPDDLIVEEIKSKILTRYYPYRNPAKYTRKFIHFKYEEDYFKNNNTCIEKYLFIGINLNYSYNDLIIKNIIE